jgi:hypothetical protein
MERSHHGLDSDNEVGNTRREQQHSCGATDGYFSPCHSSLPSSCDDEGLK